MANNKLRIGGLEELRAELRNLAPMLRAQAQGLVFDAADRAKAEIVAAYPQRTGNLRRGVTIQKDFGQFYVAVQIRSRAKHAWLYEHGSVARHYVTVDGRDHLTGSMPARPTFEPIMARRRRALNDALIELVRSQGLTVVKVA